jgi:predicted permease
MPGLAGLELDLRVVAFAAAAVVATTILSGTLPAVLAGRSGLSDTLRDDGRQTTRRSGSVRFAVSVVQVALSLTLLVGSNLLVRTVQNLYAVDPGVELDGVHAITLDLGDDVPREFGPEQDAYYERIVDAVRAVPGVRGAALNASYGPYAMAPRFQIARPDMADEEALPARVHWVTPGWFEMFGLEATAGRTLEQGDWESASLRTVVTAALAERVFGTTDVIGRTVRVGIRTFDEAEIVGVVGDVRLMLLDEPPDETFFVARPLAGLVNPISVLFTPAGPETVANVQRALEGALPAVPVPEAERLTVRIDVQLTEQRLFARLLAMFSGMALVLAGIGLYGVVSFAVAGRRREFGIRIALGADSGRVRALVLRSGAWILALGTLTGLAAASTLSRLIEARLFGVSAADASSYLTAAALMAAVGLIACWIPAHEALRTDPVDALRRE